jgi:cell division protein FtsZ
MASEDATIKIGTVLDPEMADELRVTVVATGLNRQVREQRYEPAPPRSRATNYGRYEQEAAPAPVRRDTREAPVRAVPQAAPAARPMQAAAGHDVRNYDYIDIPTFLRQQAD